MRIDDLGELTGQVLVFGGPYSNLQALDALMAEARRLDVPASNMICTGDIAAYGADPGACIDRMRRTGCPAIAGNCEEQLGAGAVDCGCGFDAGTTCSLLSVGWFGYASAHVGEAQRAWMRALPQRIVFRHLGRRYAVIHGGADAVNSFLWPDVPDAVLQAQIELLEGQVGPVDTVLCGHSGLSFIRSLGDRLWINAGVIGLPENDGLSDTRYALLAPEPRICRLSYDAASARAAMAAAGLTQGYEVALTDGIWPSQDILPASLRRTAN